MYMMGAARACVVQGPMAFHAWENLGATVVQLQLAKWQVPNFLSLSRFLQALANPSTVATRALHSSQVPKLKLACSC